MDERNFWETLSSNSFIIFFLNFSLQHPMLLLLWFRVCIRVSVRNNSFQTNFGMQNLQEQLSYQFLLKKKQCSFTHHHSSPSSWLAHSLMHIHTYSVKQWQTECSTMLLKNHKLWNLKPPDQDISLGGVMHALLFIYIFISPQFHIQKLLLGPLSSKPTRSSLLLAQPACCPRRNSYLYTNSRI